MTPAVPVSVADDSQPPTRGFADLVPPSRRGGLLDGDEKDLETIELEGDGDDPGPYARGTFQKIGSGMAVLVVLVVLPYLVPQLDRALARWAGKCDETSEREVDCRFARAWLPGEPVPFWNVIGREILGEGEAEQEAAEEVAKAEALAQSLVDREDEDDAAPLPPRKVIAPPPEDSGDGGSSLPAYEEHPDDALEIPQSLELPDPAALDPLFAALARTDAGYEGAVTRVAQWGDSVIAADHVTSAMREEMQRRFGDAGHGFHLLARPNNSYRHHGVRFDASGWTHCYIINKCRKDGLYGLGGVTVWSAGGAKTELSTAKKGAVGRAWSKVELWYGASPKGGRIRVKVDGGEPEHVDTAGDELEDRWHTITMEDGPHDVDIRPAGDGRVRLYGVVLERDGPGVVWDGYEQLGAFTNRMLYFDRDHLRRQVEHRDPDLLVFMFGGNDLTLRQANIDKYEDTWKETLAHFRGEPGDDARPCLVVAPVDHGQRSGQQIVSRPEMTEIVTRQRKAALAAGCAFFDTPAAMGGDGAAGRWRKAEPALLAGDLSHLTHAGQKLIAHYLYLALMEQYVAYRKRAG